MKKLVFGAILIVLGVISLNAQQQIKLLPSLEVEFQCDSIANALMSGCSDIAATFQKSCNRLERTEKGVKIIFGGRIKSGKVGSSYYGLQEINQYLNQEYYALPIRMLGKVPCIQVKEVEVIREIEKPSTASDDWLIELLMASMALNLELAGNLQTPQQLPSPAPSPNITIGGDTINVDVNVGDDKQSGLTKWDYKKWKKENKTPRKWGIIAGGNLPFDGGNIGSLGFWMSPDSTKRSGLNGWGVHGGYGFDSNPLSGSLDENTIHLFSLKGEAMMTFDSGILFGADAGLVTPLNRRSWIGSVAIESFQNTTIGNDDEFAEINRDFEDRLPYRFVANEVLPWRAHFAFKGGYAFGDEQKVGVAARLGSRILPRLDDFGEVTSQKQFIPTAGLEIHILKNFSLSFDTTVDWFHDEDIDGDFQVRQNLTFRKLF